MNAHDIVAAVSSRRMSAVEIVRAARDRIAAATALNAVVRRQLQCPVIVSAGNINEARLLAQEECDCDGCCQYLGCGGVGCASNATLTEAQKSFVSSAELLKAARRVTTRK
jgi:hypothetical protein